MREVLADLNFDPNEEHSPSYEGDGWSDYVACTCGWNSTGYWDGADFAMSDWRVHETGIHVYVVGSPGYDCKCHPDCGETFKSIDIRKLEDRLAELKS